MPLNEVIVVGAGVAGLACATTLADAGLRVTVLDAASCAGGRARSWVDASTGLHVDIGPHVLTTEHANFNALLRRLGTDDQVLWQPQPLITLLDSRGTLDMANSEAMPPFHGVANLPRALSRLSVRDVLSHLRLGWQAARLDEDSLRALDSQDMLSHLRRMGVSERAIDWFWRSALLALLNVSLEHCSAAAGMRVFRLMQGRSGYHFGFPKASLSQLYVPPSFDIVQRAGGQVLTDSAVAAVRVEQAAVRALRMADGREITAGCCVLALPPAELAGLLAQSGCEALEGLAGAARSFEPSAYVSTLLWFDRPIASRAFWARAWSPDDLNTDFYDLARIRPELAGGPSVIASNAIGPFAHAERDDDALIEQTLREIVQFAPDAATARVRHARVHRTAMGVPQPRPGTERLRPAARTPVDGLWRAGDWTDTGVPCSMESAARSGALAAQAVLQRMGRNARLAIDPPETYGVPGLVRRFSPATSPRNR